MTKPEIILVIDDDEDFVLLLQWAFEKARLDHKLLHLNDGREALRYFRGQGQYANRLKFPLPSLVLLDIHLPVIDGFEVLDYLRHQDQFASLPVLMLTSSESENQVLRARQLGATEIQEKPFAMSDLLHMVEEIRNHWLAGVA